MKIDDIEITQANISAWKESLTIVQSENLYFVGVAATSSEDPNDHELVLVGVLRLVHDALPVATQEGTALQQLQALMPLFYGAPLQRQHFLAPASLITYNDLLPQVAEALLRDYIGIIDPSRLVGPEGGKGQGPRLVVPNG